MSIIGISGSLSHPSRTTTLVETLSHAVAQATGQAADIVNISDFAADLGHALDPRTLPPPLAPVYRKLLAANIWVIGTPVYKASYTGLLKHFLDLVDPRQAEGKIVLLAATGGSDQHALVIEHQLRPLASFFGAWTAPTGIYAKDADFEKIDDGRSYRLVNESLETRITQAAAQAAALHRALSVTREAELLS